MSTKTDSTKALHAVAKRLLNDHPETGDTCPAPDEGACPIVHQLIYSFLLWNATPEKAFSAMSSLTESFIDHNELRIGLAHEISDAMGARYPLAEERAARLRAALNAVYYDEQAMCLDRLNAIPKREARTYLEGLPGVPRFVSSRVLLLGLGAHVFPVDDRVHNLLIGEEACEEAEIDAASAWLERQFRAGEIEPLYLAMEASLDTQRGSKARKRTKKTSKKQPAR